MEWILMDTDTPTAKPSHAATAAAAAKNGNIVIPPIIKS